MNTKTLATSGLLLVGLMAVPAASAETMTQDDNGRCIGIYEETTNPDGSKSVKCTGFWEEQVMDPLCPFLLKVCDEN